MLFLRLRFCSCTIRILSLAILLGGGRVLSGMEWGGSASAIYGDSRRDTSGTVTVDQQYTLYNTGLLLPAIRYSGFLRYRHLRSDAEQGGRTWLSESNPAAGLTWNTPFFRVRADYSYRENLGQAETDRFQGRSGDITIQTTWLELPRVHASYGWMQNVNNLELLGLDTRQRTLAGGADYSWRTGTIQYAYSHRRTENRRTGLALTADQHTGRAENSVRFWKKKALVSAAVQVQSRTEAERQPAAAEILVPLPVAAGLFAADPTPDFGPLDPSPNLVDGNLDSAASQAMNLSGIEVLNFGLDFGAATTVEMLHLYTDTLANSGLRWAVYSSADNLTWSLVQEYAVHFFSTSFLRYEIAIGRQITRYIKVVMEPQPREGAVHVTELRGFVRRVTGEETHRSTDYAATVHLSVQPATWLSASLGGNLNRTGGGATTLARDEESVQGSLSMTPVSFLRVSGRVQLGRTDHRAQGVGRADNSLYGLTLGGTWLPTLRTTLSFTQRREATSGQLVRRNDVAQMRVETVILPELSGTTEVGLGRDRRYVAEEVLKTRYIGQSLTAQPFERLQLGGEYRYDAQSAERGYVPPFRETVSVRATLRITAAVMARGDGNFYREPRRHYRTGEAALSWNVTPALSTGVTVNRILASDGGNSSMATVQALWRWQQSTEVMASYSRVADKGFLRLEMTSLRLGVQTRF